MSSLNPIIIKLHQDLLVQTVRCKLFLDFFPFLPWYLLAQLCLVRAYFLLDSILTSLHDFMFLHSKQIVSLLLAYWLGPNPNVVISQFTAYFLESNLHVLNLLKCFFEMFRHLYDLIKRHCFLFLLSFELVVCVWDVWVWEVSLHCFIL